jgi:hypothetical protein
LIIPLAPSIWNFMVVINNCSAFPNTDFVLSLRYLMISNGFKAFDNLVRTYLGEFWRPATNDAIRALLMCCHVGSVWSTRIVTSQTEWKTDHLAINFRIKHTNRELVTSFGRSWYVSCRAIGLLQCYWIFNYGFGIYGWQCLFHGPECTAIQMCCLVAYLFCADVNCLCIKILWRIDQLLSSDCVNKSSCYAIGK